jgi:hypothetical protein
MTKVLTVDDLEIEFEKQNSEHSCNWCVYIRLRKKDKEQTVLMIRTDNKPYTRFTFNSGNIVNRSNKTLSDILSNTINNVEELREIKKNLNDEKN